MSKLKPFRATTKKSQALNIKHDSIFVVTFARESSEEGRWGSIEGHPVGNISVPGVSGRKENNGIRAIMVI